MKNVGLLGELQVEQRLVENGWHPVRLDTGSMASNADLMAINKRHRVSLQVKTTTGKGHRHSHSLGFGYSTGYLADGNTVFNSKRSPLIADVVVGVSYLENDSRFVVMPVAFGEKLCEYHSDYWYNVPTRSGGKRSSSFPIYIALSGTQKAHREHHEKMKRNLLAFEDAWDLLGEPISRLHDDTAWPLLQ